MSCASCKKEYRYPGYRHINKNDTYPRLIICETCYLKYRHYAPQSRTLKEMIKIDERFGEQYDIFDKECNEPKKCDGCDKSMRSDELDYCCGRGKKTHLICKKCNGTTFYDGWQYKRNLVSWAGQQLHCPSCGVKSLYVIDDGSGLWCSRCTLKINYQE